MIIFFQSLSDESFKTEELLKKAKVPYIAMLNNSEHEPPKILDGGLAFGRYEGIHEIEHEFIPTYTASDNQKTASV